MVKRKNIRTRGKISISRYFQRLSGGENVSIDKNLSVPFNFPRRMQGRTGKVEKKRGQFYLVKIKDQMKPKTFLIHPIHLKKIRQIKKQK